MRRNPISVLALLAALFLASIGSPAQAACTAGNPNAYSVEATPGSDFTSPDAVVVHLKTNLMWKACPEGQTWNVSCVGTEASLSWANALKAANTANTTATGYGYTDWRLPNKKELESIVESCGYNPSFNRNVFPSSSSSNFWSSTSFVNTPSQAWGVGFGDGGTFVGNKTDGNFVRLVRGGLAVDSYDLVHPTVSAIYNGNGSTGGSVPVDSHAYSPGATVTALGNTGNLSKTGYDFSGWNTVSNGTGANYIAGSTFPIGSANIVLYANWTLPDADLSDLTISVGSLSPAFGSTTLAYTDTVPNANSFVTVTPTSLDGNASITVNNVAVPTKTASGKIGLAVGSNVITIAVVSADGKTKKTYTITVTRTALASSAPTIGTAVAGNQMAIVTFSAPTSTFGSAITGYTVTSSPAGGIDSNAGSTSLSHVITNLANGTAYTFTVRATDAAGLVSAASSPSNSVTPSALGFNTVRNALFINASTGANKTSVIRIINTSDLAGAITATAYNEAGAVVGTANAPLGSAAARQMLSFTSAQLETAIGYVPAIGTAKFRIVLNGNLPDFKVVNFIKDLATGNLTLGQAQVDNRAASVASSSTRTMLIENASTSANKTSVVRLINLSSQTGTLNATAYDEAGNVVGTPNAGLGTLGSQQMLTFISSQLETVIGFTPSAGTAKYRIVFTSSLPSFEVINFIKDTATGNLTLGQSQTDTRQASIAASSVRNALFVSASSSANKTSVVRVININSQTGALTATAFDEAGNSVGTPNAPLGAIAAQQMLTFTSAQLETAIGYVPASATAKYRIVFSANLPGFEVVNFIKDIASGNLTLGQAQIDDGSATGGTSSRGALFVNPSTSTNKTSALRLINLNNQSGAVTATAYDEAGAVVGTAGAALGTLAPNQMLTFTSAQLETALGYVPSADTAKYRIVFSANLPSFELINFIKDVATGNLVLGQIQVD